MSNNEKYREAYDMLCEWDRDYVTLKNWKLDKPAFIGVTGTKELSKWLLDNKDMKVDYKEYIYLQDLQKAIDDQKAPVYNPVKNISRSKYERCPKTHNGCDLYKSRRSGCVWMWKSFCNKYYYWVDYNTKNEVIYFRGEVDWVKSNYEPYEDEDTTTCEDGVLAIFSVAEDAFDTGGLGREEEYVEVVECPEADKLIAPVTEWTDKHYDFNYTLTEDDIEQGFVKIDPYFVNRMWRINSWDDTGAAFHCMKNFARICNNKNPLERDLRSQYKQIKRLCDLHGVKV